MLHNIFSFVLIEYASRTAIFRPSSQQKFIDHRENGTVDTMSMEKTGSLKYQDLGSRSGRVSWVGFSTTIT